MRKFGVEIECGSNLVARSQVVSAIQAAGINVQSSGYSDRSYRNGAWKVKDDSSLRISGAMEVVSPPLTDLEQVRKVCEVINHSTINATVNQSCGLHVHFDTADLTRWEMAEVALRWQHFLPTLHMILPASRHNNHYCQPFDDREIISLKSVAATKGASTAWVSNRYKHLNLTNIRPGGLGTMEFRSAAGTTSYLKIAFWVKLLDQFITATLAKVRATPTPTASEAAVVSSEVDALPGASAQLRSFAAILAGGSAVYYSALLPQFGWRTSQLALRYVAELRRHGWQITVLRHGRQAVGLRRILPGQAATTPVGQPNATYVEVPPGAFTDGMDGDVITMLLQRVAEVARFTNQP